MLFACPSVYKKDIPAETLAAHRTWLKAAVDSGAIVSAGRREPAIGGLIILRAESREAAVALLAQDPFVAEGIAEYDPMGFNPSIGELKG
ncbi:YciI family protein [Gemmobacter nectariphilus]|uniref:YciI family protein n=1 Tax=Gemmobacter nectariphilus TaxID=220343 RepID=UPI0004050457|nr:YciI family protein [Gemmobacter nectariphilus]